jgi:hypothetical protein
MKELIYISRSFVEIGAFTVSEILDFSKRGIITSSDYLRVHNEDTWHHSAQFIAALPKATAPAKAPVAAKKAVKKAAKKATPASKTPAKKKQG